MDGKPVVVVASPVYSPQEEISGVIFGTLGLDRIDRFISSFRFGRTGETYLVDNRGIMLTESRFTPVLIETGAVRETTKYELSARRRWWIRFSKVKPALLNTSITGEAGSWPPMDG